MFQETSAISVQNLFVFYQSVCVLSDISVSIAQGALVAIVGPNGGGKTTFIKTIVGLIQPRSGIITFFNHSLSEYRSRIGYIPQRLSVDWDFPASVFDVVLMGRYAHIGWFWRPKQEDRLKAYEALHLVGLKAYANCPINELSGGQQQRVFVARALAQEADILLLDEPFVGIDIATEKVIIEILQTLRSQGKTIVIVHHDLQTIANYFDWVFFLNRKTIAYGPVDTVCVPKYIRATYGKMPYFSQGMQNINE